MTVIGSRWKPGPVERRDADTGFYESINHSVFDESEATVQMALLMRAPAPSLIERVLAFFHVTRSKA